MLKETESGKHEEEEAKAVPSSSELQGAGFVERGPPVAEPYPGERLSQRKNQQQHTSEQSQRTQMSEDTKGANESDIEHGQGGAQASREQREGETEREKASNAEQRPEQSSEAPPPAANIQRAAETGKRFFREYGGACLVIVFASFVLMVQASVLANTPNVALAYTMSYVYYAVSFGVITLILGLILLVIRRRNVVEGTPRTILVALFFIWCTLGAGIFTFRSPFMNTGNGYFMSWIIFFAAYFMLKSEVQQTKMFESKLTSMGNLLFPLLLTSLIEFFAALTHCTNGCSGNAAYAVSVGLISFLVVLIYPFVRNKFGITPRRIVAGFLAFWWLLAAFILTLGYPFQSTGNGYFSSWISLFLSVLLLEAEFYG